MIGLQTKYMLSPNYLPNICDDVYHNERRKGRDQATYFFVLIIKLAKIQVLPVADDKCP